MKQVRLQKIEEIFFSTKVEKQNVKKQAVQYTEANFLEMTKKIQKSEENIQALIKQIDELKLQIEKEGEELAKSTLDKKQKELQNKLQKELSNKKKLEATLKFALSKKNVQDSSLANQKPKIEEGQVLLEELIGISKREIAKIQDQSKVATLNKLYTERSEDLRIYLARYTKQEALGKKIFGESFGLEKPGVEIDIYNQFEELNNQYRYFENSLKYKEYERCYKTCLYIAEVIERNNTGDEVASRAYKMLALFMQNKGSTLQAVDKFIQSYASKYTNPIHDIFQNNIPVYHKDLAGKENYNLNGWRQLISKVGMIAIQHLKSAEAIEKSIGKVPEDRKELEETLTKLTYARHKENEPLAKLYHQYNVAEDIYNRSLDLIAQGKIKIKTEDNIPSVIIDIGKEVDKDKAGYYLVKLPAGDMRGMILGKITDCCQSIGGESEKCVIDGMTRENNGFYVLVKAKKNKKFDPYNIDWDSFEKSGHEIVGQGYIWKGMGGNLTFDSWENLRPQADDSMMVKVLEKFGEKVAKIDSSISRITIGKGGKTPSNIKSMDAAYAEAISEGVMYG